MPETLEERLATRVRQRRQFGDVTGGGSSASSTTTSSLEERLADRIAARAQLRGVRGGIAVTKDALLDLPGTVKGMASSIYESGKAALSPVRGEPVLRRGYNVLGADDPQMQPTGREQLNTRGVSREEKNRGLIDTGVNVAGAIAPLSGLLARSAVNTGLGAYYDKDDRVRGATSGLLLGELLTQGIKAPGRIGRATTRALDVSEGALESATRAMSESVKGTSPREGPSIRRRPLATLPMEMRPALEPPPTAETYVSPSTSKRRPAEAIEPEAPIIPEPIPDVVAPDLAPLESRIAERLERRTLEPETVTYPPEPLDTDITPVVSANGDFAARPGVMRSVNRDLRKGPSASRDVPRITPEEMPDMTPRISVEEANKRTETAVAAQKAAQEKKAIRRSRWAPGESIRDEAGALRKDLTNVPDDVLEAELQRITELNASEEAAAGAVRDAAYRADYEELPRTERLGRKGQEDLPDADGTIDPERLLSDNKTVAEYNKNTIIRSARARAAARLEAELAARKPEKYRRVDDTPEPEPVREVGDEPEAQTTPDDALDTSFDFGANAPDPKGQPREYMNWTRANYSKTVEARIQEIVERGRESGTIDKGYQSFETQGDQARAYKEKVAKDLLEDPLTIDKKKLERLTGSEIEGLKLLVGENAATLEAASRVINDPNATAAEVTQASELFDMATSTTDQALGKIVSETAQIARSLGYMRNTAKHSLDPEVWLVQAKRMLGDAPMTDSVMLNIRRLAREAAEACR